MPDDFLDLKTLGMGNSKSRHKGLYGRTKKNSSGQSAGSRDQKRSSDGNRDRAFSAEIHERFAEDEELQNLRHTINHKPELFVLNNLMMSVQFFENYDEEIASIKQWLVSSKEAELNAHLPATKQALIPDVLQQHVARRVRFTYENPTRNLTIELLHPTRIYVVFDNIEVTEESNESHYSQVNETVTYNLQLKPSPNNKDCVLLQRINESPTKKTKNTDDLVSVFSSTTDCIYSDGDSVYGGKSSTSFAKSNREVHDDESVYEESRYDPRGVFDYPSTSRIKDESIDDSPKTSDRPTTSARLNKLYNRTRQSRSANGSLAGSSSSGYRSGIMDSDSESNCSYPRTAHATPKTSNSSLDSQTTVSTSELPQKCFKKVVYSYDGNIYNHRRLRKQRMNKTDKLIKKTLKSQNYTVHYLSAARFTRHFCRLFAEKLAAPMGFDATSDGDGSDGVLYRTKVERLNDTANTKLDQFEIMPSVRAPWPECAQEWLDRSRATWPSYDVLEKVKEIKCHLVPDLTTPEATGSHRGLDWHLVLPGVERYLETCLTYPQVRVYLTALMLQKNFMRPIDSSFGLSVSHIKNKLFWLVEEDERPGKWMEHRTGESLVNFLESLHKDVQQENPRLPDYFLPDKNLLQGSKNLLRTQKQLSRIIGNPVMYVLHAMEKIMYSPGFFPRLDFAELFRILKDDTILLANPALAAHVARPVGRANRGDGTYEQTTGMWEKSKRDDAKEAVYARKPVDRSLINPRRDVNQVTDISVKIENMEPRRLSFLLDFFVRHFIKMAERCNHFRALPQKVAYVDQAERLSFLLSEHPSHREVAKVYLEKLCALKRRAARPRSQANAAMSPPPPPPPDPPETPRRNAAAYVRPLTQRHEFRSEDNLADRRMYVKLPTSGETKEYELAGATSSLYRLQAPPGPRNGRQVVDVTIHEENSETVEIRKATNAAGGGAGTSGEKTRVVSLVDTQDESHLTETTCV